MSNLLIGLGVTVGVGAACVLICWRVIAELILKDDQK